MKKCCLMCGWSSENDICFFIPTFKTEGAAKNFRLCWNCCGVISAESRVKIAEGNLGLVKRMVDTLQKRLEELEVLESLL